MMTCVCELSVQLSGVRMISLYSMKRNLSVWEDAQYILARAAENFLESHINSCGNTLREVLIFAGQLKPPHIHQYIPE